MLEYDKERNIVFARKNKLGSQPHVTPTDIGQVLFTDSNSKIPAMYADYASFRQFIENDIDRLVREVWLPKFRKELNIDENLVDVFEVIVKQDDPGYFQNYDYKVRVKLDVAAGLHMASESSPIEILSIPMMDKYGLIHHDGKRYALIKKIEQDNTISYSSSNGSDGGLKIHFDRANLRIFRSTKKWILNLSDVTGNSNAKANLDALFTMFGLAMQEGFDAKLIFNEFRTDAIRSVYSTLSQLEDAAYAFGGSSLKADGTPSTKNVSITPDTYIKTVIPKLRLQYKTYAGEVDTKYDVTGVREDLNSTLSLDRAIGEILAEDCMSVLNPGKVVLPKGTLLSRINIEHAKREGVYNLIVVNIPNIEGNYLAEPILIPYVPKGTKISDELAGFIHEDCMYTSKNYYFEDNPLVLDMGTRLTKDLVKLIEKCGIKSILISKKEDDAKIDGSGVKRIFLQKEILSNRFFRRSEVGLDGNPLAWVRLDSNNEFADDCNYLTAYDFAAMISLTAELNLGNSLGIINNIDSGFRKRLILTREQYTNAFKFAVENGLSRCRALREAWAKEGPAEFAVNGANYSNKFYPCSEQFFKYLRDNVRCLEQITSDVYTNPVSFIAGCTKVDLPGKGGKFSISDKQRQMPIGSYGRLDPYETPQSGKLGTVLNIAMGCYLDDRGHMYTPYLPVRNGRVIDKPEILSVEAEENLKIADINSLELDDNGVILNKNDSVMCRVPAKDALEKQSFTYVRVSEIDYVNYYVNQTLSWSSATIPFLGSNDAARVSFGISQTKQAKGCVNSQIPRIITSANLEIPKLNNEFCIFAEEDGYIQTLNSFSVRSSQAGRRDIQFNIFVKYGVHPGDDVENPAIGRDVAYTFKEYDYTSYSVTVRRAEFKEGQFFKKGDVLVSSNFVKDGILAMGRNTLVAFVPTGYNYEDGAHASDGFCNNFMSYRVNTEVLKKVFLKKDDKRDRLHKVMEGKWITPGKDVAFDVTRAVKLNSSDGTNKVAKEYKEFKTEKIKGFLQDVRPVVEKKGNGSMKETGCAEVNCISIDPFSNGDKESNRHGNKGVLPESIKNSKMPRLINGLPIDVCNNPHGVISRMNIGQTKECNIGLVMEVLDTYLCIDSFNSISNEEVNMFLKFTVELMNSTCDVSELSSIYDKYPDIPMALKERCSNRINEIRFWAGCFDERGEAYLINPRNGDRLTETKALIGVVHTYKLIQESEKKLHVRGGAMHSEPYLKSAMAPTHGTKSHGGQRYGYMEFDALCSYGAANLIKELTNERCDNPIARSNMNADVYLPDSVKNDYIIDDNGQRVSLTRFLYTMLALGVYFDCDDDEFVALDKDNELMASFRASTIANVSIDNPEGGKKNTTKSEVNLSGDARNFAELMKRARMDK